MAARILKKLLPRTLGLATTQPTSGPLHIERAALQLGRGKLTEQQPDSPLVPASIAKPLPRSVGIGAGTDPERPAPATPEPALAAPSIAPELPIRRLAPRRRADATTAAIGPPRPPSLSERLASSTRPDGPETPTHSYLARSGAATSPLAAARNRSLRKHAAILRGRRGPRVSLGVGVSPTDLANGLQTPERGRWFRGRKALPAGTPQPIREAPLDELPISLTPPATSSDPTSSAPFAAAAATLTGPGFGTSGVSTIDAEQAAAPEETSSTDPGEGLGRFAFLAGAVFVAWMVLGKARVAA